MGAISQTGTARSRDVRAVRSEESAKEKTDRQFLELLNELRVVLPGAQVLLAFLFTVPFAARFGQIDHHDRLVFLACLLFTVIGTILLMAPTIYHRLRWEQGGKGDVVEVAHAMFLTGTAALAAGILAAIFLVTDVLFEVPAAIFTTALIGLAVLLAWYVVPLTHGRRARTRSEE